jgi:hypothetical protein
MAPQTDVAAAPTPVSPQPLYNVWPPRVESREDLDLVTAEIVRCDAFEKCEGSQLKDDIARITREAEGRLEVALPGAQEPIGLADWRAELLKAAEKYVRKRRQELLEDGRKSLDLNHARAGFRDDPPALAPLPDFDEDGNDKILKQLLKDLRLHLQETADFTDGAAGFVEIKVSWRKRELLKAYSDQLLKLPVLKKTGFTVTEESEEFYVKELPKADLKSQSRKKK